MIRDINGNVQYKNKVSTKTVYDPKVFNTEIMTNEIIQIVEKNLSSNELENAYKDINKTIPFDINYNGLKIRTHIRANSKNNGLELENYYFDVK